MIPQEPKQEEFPELLQMQGKRYRYEKSLALDFDGVLFSERKPNGDIWHPLVGQAVPTIHTLIRELHEIGWFIVIHSCRASGQGWGVNQVRHRLGIVNMVDALNYYQIPWDVIWGVKLYQNIWVPDTAAHGKPLVKYILDDNAQSLGQVLMDALDPSTAESVLWRAVQSG
jgi:hypothetical protein